MDGIETDFDREELLALVRELRAEVRELRAENERLRAELAAAGRSTPRLDKAYSLQAEQRRRDQRLGRRRKQQSERRGRKPTQDRLDQADRAEIVLPEGCVIEECTAIRERPVWRIERGRAVLVAYHLFRGPTENVPSSTACCRGASSASKSTSRSLTSRSSSACRWSVTPGRP